MPAASGAAATDVPAICWPGKGVTTSSRP